MHKVLEGFSFEAFEGSFPIHGTARQVSFVAPNEKDEERGVLAIQGLSLADALHLLDQVSGGLLKGKDAEQPTNGKSKIEVVDKTVEAKTEAPAKEPAKAKAAKPAPAPTPPPPPAAAAKEPEPDVDDDDLGDEDHQVAKEPSIDIGALKKMEKLRPVIQHLMDNGYTTASQVVEVAKRIKDDVPVLIELAAKGDYEKRIDRAVVMMQAPKEA
jgi:hypothetical protein